MGRSRESDGEELAVYTIIRCGTEALEKWPVDWFEMLLNPTITHHTPPPTRSAVET